MAPVTGAKRKRTKNVRANRASFVDQEASTHEQQPRKKRGRPSNAELAERNSSHQSNFNDGDIAPQYQTIAPVIRGVARHTIDTKWEPLPTSAVNQISQLLNDVERSVVTRLQDDRKRTQASTAVEMVIRRLQRKLSKGQPFPPSTRSLAEEDFDFEKILDSSRALEARLTPMLHSIELLKAETAKEEASLEEERAALEALEANARAEASRRKKTTKALHDILRDDVETGSESQVVDNLIVDRKSHEALLATARTGEELEPVIDQLYNHLDSIQNNVSQIDGLASAMGGSRAALQDVLFRHVGTTWYVQVVLG